MGLFSRDGLLLDLFAHENYTLERFMNDGIRAGSNWVNIGYNAVRQGIIGRESLCTIGISPIKKVCRLLCPYQHPKSL